MRRIGFTVALVAAVACSGWEWPEATPESRSIRSSGLASLVRTAKATGLPLHQMTVVGEGAVVARASFYPYDGAAMHDVASVTKSVTATLVGIAIGRGELAGVHQKVVDSFPGRTIAGLDDRKRAMTIEHLLTMTSGFDCGLSGGEPELLAMLGTSDWVGYALDLPMHDAPGTTFAYCSPAYHLLSAILARATGKSLREYAEAHLFGPLGFTGAEWLTDPAGLSRGWGDLRLHADDLAKLGWTYLEGGRWLGRQVVPAEWVAYSRTPFVAAGTGQDYGAGWWIPRSPPGVYTANGRGGQHVVVWPEKRVVLVTLAGGIDLGTVAAGLLTTLSPSPLADDPDGASALEEAVAAAALPPSPIAVPPLPPIAAQVSGRTYRLDPNVLGVSRLAVTFHGGAEASLTLDGPERTLRVGLDGVPRFSENRLAQRAGVKGEWQGSTFVVDLDEITLINRFHLELAFDGDAVSVHAKELSSGLFPEQTIRGVAVR